MNKPRYLQLINIMYDPSKPIIWDEEGGMIRLFDNSTQKYFIKLHIQNDILKIKQHYRRVSLDDLFNFEAKPKPYTFKKKKAYATKKYNRRHASRIKKQRGMKRASKLLKKQLAYIREESKQV